MSNTTITYDLSQLFGQFYRTFYSKNLKGTGDFDERLNIKFGIDKQLNHFIIKACIDLLEDTEYAIENYERFGLNGPTKYDNTGERYLRLYGLLNAVNSQKSIVITLYEILKVPYKKEVIKKLQKIKIIDTRHMVASHSVDYFSHERNEKDFFRIGMTTIRGKGEDILIVSKNKSISVDLVKELKEFKLIINQELLKILEYINKRFNESKSKARQELTQEIEILKAKMDGHLIINGAAGKVIIKTT